MAIVATFLPKARRSALQVMESLHTATPKELAELNHYRLYPPKPRENNDDITFNASYIRSL